MQLQQVGVGFYVYTRTSTIKELKKTMPQVPRWKIILTEKNGTKQFLLLNAINLQLCSSPNQKSWLGE